MTHSAPWITSLLIDLTNSIFGGADEQLAEEDSLHVELTLSRGHSPKWQEYITVDGQIKGRFHPPCIRCLERSRTEISSPISACLLSDDQQQQAELQDITDIIINNRERELFFYSGRQVDFTPLLWELLMMVIDPNPIHHPDCQGLCPTCGLNLNMSSCSHKKTLA
ncbi:MAG: DUF177 domain-containing protein [Bdellovibrionales bacterium]|jgi:uncharacterized protein|nr:DUF177 domain-containing protein [Bdellovibrionales bacterium]MBT3526463.1 DUF177 domain-containing protein [Bdellovibrionales bacterium]MBT7669360.1 DUF177 domain-containing protein [Bdellovibrionales bacterium]MBT7767619.1 DUF177 domain-containing protein [Bdellovibrionales bacterium]